MKVRVPAPAKLAMCMCSQIFFKLPQQQGKADSAQGKDVHPREEEGHAECLLNTPNLVRCGLRPEQRFPPLLGCGTVPEDLPRGLFLPLLL